MIAADEALAQLREGNRRFIAGTGGRYALVSSSRRKELIEGQEPRAVILGCSDSRAPAEHIFDQGLGDLFVIRIAGNIVAPSQIGSVEFAVEAFKTKLIVVLGHSHCGAVMATLKELKRPLESQSKHLRSIVDRVRPAVEPVVENHDGGDDAALLKAAIRANIRASAEQLRHGSPFLEDSQEEGVTIVGAEYSLASGEVEFFDGV